MANVSRLTPRLQELALSNWKRGSMAGANVWPNLDEVLARRGHDLYQRAFESNDVVRAAITLQRAAVVGAGLDIVAGDPTSRDSVASAKQAALDIAALRGSFEFLLGEFVQVALIEGWACAEKCWDVGPDGRWRLVKFKVPLSSGLDFVCDKFGNVEHVTQKSVGGASVIPYSRLVHLTFGSSDPYGLSAIKTCWRLVWQREAILQHMSVYLERFGEPAAIAKIPHGVGERR